MRWNSTRTSYHSGGIGRCRGCAIRPLLRVLSSEGFLKEKNKFEVLSGLLQRNSIIHVTKQVGHIVTKMKIQD